MDGYIKGNSGNLVFTSTCGKKNILAKLTKLWDKSFFRWISVWSVNARIW